MLYPFKVAKAIYDILCHLIWKFDFFNEYLTLLDTSEMRKQDIVSAFDEFQVSRRSRCIHWQCPCNVVSAVNMGSTRYHRSAKKSACIPETSLAPYPRVNPKSMKREARTRQFLRPFSSLMFHSLMIPQVRLF